VPPRDSERLLSLIPSTASDSSARFMLQNPTGKIEDLERELRIGKQLRRYYVEAGCQTIQRTAKAAGIRPPKKVLNHWRLIGRSHRLPARSPTTR